MFGSPAVCLEQLLATLDDASQIADLPDRRTRMNALKEEQLRAIERANAGKVPLVHQGISNRAVGLSGNPPHRFGDVPIGAEQVGSEMSDNSVLRRRWNQLDDRKPVSHGI